jgi:molecular chaperone DnaK
MSYVLAIDVGTSFTAAALVKPDQSLTPTPEILPLGLHGSAVPSVLFYADDGRILVGEAAERRGLDNPQRMVREFKRRIGDSVPLAVGEDWLAAEDVYASMARWVVDRAEEREGGSPSSIIMTHPAAWGRHRTSVVLAALNVAGLRDVTLISEPEAAALHYASQTRVDNGSTIAVYDLGGGTFDTAVLRKAGAGNFELLGRPDGIETLGGADFDAAVLHHVMGHVAGSADLDPSTPDTLAALSRLRRECREAKEALSMDSEASVAVALPGMQQSVRLVRSEFEAMIEAPIRDTLDALVRSLQSIHVEAQDLSAVLLIGGSSRIPLVAEMISVELDRPIAVDADPKSSICLGAAVAGLPSMGAGAVDAASASAASASAMVERPHVVRNAPTLTALKAASAKPGKHAPRPRVRMAAAAAVAATALTIVTATAAQSPDGAGLLATMFGNQAADVMRGAGAQGAEAEAATPQANGAGAATTGNASAGLEAGVGTGVTRAGKNPVRPGTATPGKGSTGTGSGTAAGAVAGPVTTPGAAAGSVTTPAAPGTATTPGTPTTPPTTPAPDPTGGAANGPTPPPVTPPPTTPPVSEPVTPPATPADPATPPDPVTPPPSPAPTVPQPEPPVTQDPVTPSPDPTVPQEPTPPPATLDPTPQPTESSPTPDPALLSAV